MTKVFINGFGRIGRTVLRAWAQGGWPEVEIVGINDIAEADLCSHLFEYDSVFGPFNGEVHLDGKTLHVNGRAIPMSQTPDVSTLDLTGIDLVNTASRDNVELGEAEIREGLKGNYCRCTGYQNIVRAVATAAQQMED